MKSLSGEALDAKLREFLAEDVGPGDVTTEWTVPAEARARGRFVARTACVVSGLSIARRVFELLDPELGWEAEAPAGSLALPEATLARLSGRARALLTAERVALNLLQRMCGIATVTRRYVGEVVGTNCRILDTRKTAPGLRAFDRMAVRDGGGCNHRDGLFDMVLIKDNHRRLAGGVRAALSAARRRAEQRAALAAPTPGMEIEIEIESEEELRDAIAAGAGRILIDNQTPETVARWARIAREGPAPPFLEASGNMTLERVRAYALAGADAVSVGALTHSVAAADIALELEADE
jgi:nicotinate-nucleotide pyrophosphorylase (carboxylating)